MIGFIVCFIFCIPVIFTVVTSFFIVFSILSILLCTFVLPYLIGSIPFGLIFSKIFLNYDVRNAGSGNIGATNVLRTGNKTIAVLTVVCDILKGYLPVIFLSKYMHTSFCPSEYLIGFFAVLGHVFPIWLRFKGGKGVATALGSYFAIYPLITLILMGVWGLSIRFIKISSLSSLVTLLCGALITLHYSYWGMYIFLLILFTHRSNINRLLKGIER